MKEIALPSGSKLRLTLAPFAESKALFQACMEEAKGCGFESRTEVLGFVKDVICTAMYSPKIEAAIRLCMKRCLIDNQQVEDKLFEAEDKRQDWVIAMYEVAQENVSPFLKGLYARYSPMLESLRKLLA